MWLSPQCVSNWENLMYRRLWSLHFGQYSTNETAQIRDFFKLRLQRKCDSGTRNVYKNCLSYIWSEMTLIYIFRSIKCHLKLVLFLLVVLASTVYIQLATEINTRRLKQPSILEILPMGPEILEMRTPWYAGLLVHVQCCIYLLVYEESFKGCSDYQSRLHRPNISVYTSLHDKLYVKFSYVPHSLIYIPVAPSWMKWIGV